MAGAVAFVTDFGCADTYAGALVGAVWRVDPGLRAVAATHGVRPGDVLGGAYHLKAAAAAFPRGTVLCAVVDPGVGTPRRALAVEAAGVRCVAPDNGLASYLWAEADEDRRRCVELPGVAGASATFHGRDIFAPAAARLAAGAALTEVGTPGPPPQRLDEAFPAERDGVLRARVAVVDRFGNAITTVRARDLRGRRVRSVAWRGESRATAWVRTYAEIDEGLALLLGSCDHVEIAARGREASALGAPGRGEVVELTVE